MKTDKDPGISFLICTFNSERHLAEVLEAVARQAPGEKHTEVIIVDDYSTDSTLRIAEVFRERFENFTVIDKTSVPSTIGTGKTSVAATLSKTNSSPTPPQKGGATSLNLGFQAVQGDIVCLVDSDAIIDDGWLQRILKEFDDPTVAAAAGCIKTANPRTLLARFTGAELEDRYSRIRGKDTDHVSTCNTACRKDVLDQIGLVDISLRYGYDVDLSHKMKQRGYRLVIIKDTGCRHYWRESLAEYCRQQFNYGYGRMALIKRYPVKLKGDTIANLRLMLQVPLLYLAMLSLFKPRWFKVLLFALLTAMIPQTARLIRTKNDPVFILFPLFFLLRNMVWAAAAGKYLLDGIVGRNW